MFPGITVEPKTDKLVRPVVDWTGGVVVTVWLISAESSSWSHGNLVEDVIELPEAMKLSLVHITTVISSVELSENTNIYHILLIIILIWM